MNGPFGFVVINKPEGLSSHDCVNRVRKIFKIKRVGHGGTLDPAVTGVLPIALGSATRLLPYLPGEKTYQGIIQLGRKTTTDDLHGEVVSNQLWPSLDRISLELHLDKFRGLIRQHPPQVSSIHIEGERAYKRVRRGENFNVPHRAITIHELILRNWDQDLGQIQINVHCSSGTYIRSLARDLGNSLGCGGCLASLHRTQALGFQETQSFVLPRNNNKELITPPNVITPLHALRHLSRLQLSTEEELINWRTGRQIIISNKRLEPSKESKVSVGQKGETFVLVIDPVGEVIGIAIWCSQSLLQPKVVFNALG